MGSISEIIAPGNTVVIKPNLVKNTSSSIDQDCVTTHLALVRVLIDCCWKAMGGRGRIIVGDSPGDTADFPVLVQQTGYKQMIGVLQDRGINVSLMNFRMTKTRNNSGGSTDTPVYTCSVYCRPWKGQPLCTGVIAAGWNAFMLDTSLLSLLNIDVDKIPLYKSAKECDWFLQNGEGEILLNANPVKKDETLPF